MKYSIVCLLLSLFSVGDSPFYSFGIDCPGGRQVQMSDYRGRKVVIGIFNPANRNMGLLTLLDSIKGAVPSISILAIPASDFSGPAQDTSLYNVQGLMGNQIIIARSMFVKRSAADNQNPLFKWLTSASQNGHFDRDVEEEGQLFFVNERGVLYGVLVRASGLAIAEALKQRISQ